MRAPGRPRRFPEAWTPPLLVAVSAVAALLLLVAGCGGAPKPSGSPGTVRASVSGADAVSIGPEGPAEAIVLYLHGNGGGAEDVVSGKMAPMATALVAAGYAVVSSDAGGDGFGNPAAVEDYAAAVRWGRELHGDAPLVLLAESMGGLSALPLMAGGDLDPVVGMVGVSPAMTTQGWQQTDYAGEIRAAWGDTPPADPMTLPAEAFRGDAFLLWTADEDTITPTPTNAGAFAARVQGLAEVTLETCRGEHVAPSCYQPGDVTRWVGRQLAER